MRYYFSRADYGWDNLSFRFLVVERVININVERMLNVSDLGGNYVKW